MPVASGNEKQGGHAFTPTNHLTRTPPQQESKPVGPPACPAKREMRFTAKMMTEREEKEKSNKKQNTKHKPNISDIMIKMKNAIGKLEKQRTTSEPNRVKEEVLQQLKKITEHMEQFEKHEERAICNHPEPDNNLEQTRLDDIEKEMKEIKETLNEIMEIKEILKEMKKIKKTQKDTTKN